jgi:hypothetical protein
MTDIDRDRRTPRKRIGYELEFTNSSWGEEVRELVQVTKKLGNPEWNQIVADCYLDHGVWFRQYQGVESDNEEDNQVAKLQRKRRA